MEYKCGNIHHPNGAWHTATPLPRTLAGLLIYKTRCLFWGCGCPRNAK